MVPFDFNSIKKKRSRKINSRRLKGIDVVHRSNVPEARRVYFHRTKEEWRARYVEDTKRKMKCFSLKRYRNEHALALAECFLSEMQRTNKVPHDDDINIWYNYLLKLGDLKNHDIGHERNGARNIITHELNKEIASHYPPSANYLSTCGGAPNSDALTQDKHTGFKNKTSVIAALLKDQTRHSWIAEGSLDLVPSISFFGEARLRTETEVEESEKFSNRGFNQNIKQVHETKPPIFSKKPKTNFQESNFIGELSSLEKYDSKREPDNSMIKAPIQEFFKNKDFLHPKYSHRNKHKFKHLNQSNYYETIQYGASKPRSPSPSPERDLENSYHFSPWINFMTGSDRLLHNKLFDSELNETLTPSILSSCARSRKQFWDMRYNYRLNHNEATFHKQYDNTPSTNLDKSVYLSPQLDLTTEMSNIHLCSPKGTSFSIPNEPNTLSSYEGEPYQSIFNNISDQNLSNIDNLSLLAPIINFELLYKHLDVPFNSHTSQSTQDSKPYIEFKNTTRINPRPSISSLKNDNYTSGEAMQSLDQSYDASKTINLNPTRLKNEFFNSKHSLIDSLLTDEVINLLKPLDLYPDDLYATFSHDTTCSEIENKVIKLFSQSDFQTLELDLKNILHLSEMKEYSSFASSMLEALRELDEQLVHTLIESENLHTALYLYKKLRGMESFELKQIEMHVRDSTPSSDSFTNSTQPKESNSLVTSYSTLNSASCETSVNDLEEILNLESLHILSESLMEKKQNILNVLSSSVTIQLEKLHAFFPCTLDTPFRNILMGNCEFSKNSGCENNLNR